MKIGIITFHRAKNYGAVLQCYALQLYLQSLGCDVQIIDYKNDQQLSYYKIWNRHRLISKNPFKTLLNIFKEIPLIKHRIKRNREFEKFFNNYYDLQKESIQNIYTFDLIIIGSDQVWNTHLTTGFDKIYWGNFRIRSDAKIISYAASIEEYWDKSDDKTAKELLNRFDAISVREQSTAEYLKGLLKRNINVSVDPTLLIDPIVWNNLAKLPPLSYNYLLLYQVRNSIESEKYAKDLALKMGLKLICLSAAINQTNSKECIDASPEEFLGWFKNASYVICASFHGTIFSVIFKKPFVSLKLPDGRNQRVESLLKKLNIPERLVDINSKENLPDLDWNKIHCCLKKLREPSQQYLSNFIA